MLRDNTQGVTADTYRQLNLFSEVFERVRRDYVKPVTDKQLVEAAVNGMLTNLDPHSAYLNADDFKNMQVQTRGEFGGLGIEVTMENSVVKVVSPIDDTPAAKANIKPNDFIVAIDGAPVMGLTLTEAVDKLRGKPQSRVTLSVVRERQDPFDVTLTRDIIRIKSVKSEMKGDVGYLRISSFNEQTTDNSRAAIKKFITDNGDKLKGLVVDMRNNPGGLLDQSISVASLFLDNNSEVVSTKGRHPEDNQVYKTETDPIVPKDLPVITLINSGSASAAEIVAGALQDHKRAVVIGTQSFGKGSVQTVMPVPGYGAIRITTAYYFTPSGRSIQVTGVKPNIEVRQKGEKDRLTFSEADLKGALANPNGAKAIKSQRAANDNSVMPEEKDRDRSKDESVANDTLGDLSKDTQLQRAMELIHGISTYQTGDAPVVKSGNN
ncbi:MAG TPA: peptidase S41 [Rhodospirillaceae bacterium]|nr:peptidase S41 [Rhodospirillaceae bacterium]